MNRYLIFIIIITLIIDLFQVTKQELIGQNDTILETTSLKLSLNEKVKGTKTNNMTNTSTPSSKTIMTPPNKHFREYLRCRQLKSLNTSRTPYSCPYDFEDDIRICWPTTYNGTYAQADIEYDSGLNNFYDNVRDGVANCTLQRFCQSNGTWAMTTSPDIQCKICIGEGRPVTFNSISIKIETMSLSLSLLSLTIAVLCMINVKRLHLPRNLLHMHLFFAFILRSIVKLVFIHLIIGGYPLTMMTYTRDKCGNIEIISKSSSLFHVIGCRILSSLFWYTDAVSQTFIFCEAMFLFTALTSHLFRDRGCLLFVLWGWLSPLVWLTMWIASHIITDKIKDRSTCWLEADTTTYFYYFFYVPYAFYLFINFGIFLYLVRLLYSKYQSNNAHTNRTGNRHLIKSILILIPLFGLHSICVMWIFYHKNQGHTKWYFIVVIFKAIFGDLQGFFTSLIYFYFNTEIRYEVLRQVQRTLLSNDTVRRSSAGDTLSTRLSVFRISFSRHRHSSIPMRNEKRRTTSSFSSRRTLTARQICWRKFLAFICPCLISNVNKKLLEQEHEHRQAQHQQKRPSVEPNNYQLENSPGNPPNLTNDDDIGGISSPLLKQNRSSKGTIDNDGLTCDTLVVKNGIDDEVLSDEILSDENDVTIHQTSITGEHTSSISNHTPLPIRNNLTRSNSDEHLEEKSISKDFIDNKSLE
ncbi:unnamed protein product [Adineta steineri]|uniref:Uncharacterized protein n=1 Tax=Adineta steineri TaxID=433720 RepID=A0A815XPJ9_9BILA|nr:unnamed protein product [Adineta steineri]CAF1560176.1 unnamed protein product [Adineta steineri]